LARPDTLIACACLIAGNAGSHRFPNQPRDLGLALTCGSWLASDRARSDNILVSACLIAGKPAPTGFFYILVAYGAFAEALVHWEASRVSATLAA